MTLPVPIDKYCEALDVSRATVESWADNGEVVLWQPGGKGGKVFVRDEKATPKPKSIVESWDEAEKKKTAS